MTLTSLVCHQQAAVHRRRATEAALANVRGISVQAAAAWELEAVAAEKREGRDALKRTVELDVKAIGVVAKLDLQLSENPDQTATVETPGT